MLILHLRDPLPFIIPLNFIHFPSQPLLRLVFLLLIRIFPFFFFVLAVLFFLLFSSSIPLLLRFLLTFGCFSRIAFGLHFAIRNRNFGLSTETRMFHHVLYAHKCFH